MSRSPHCVDHVRVCGDGPFDQTAIGKPGSICNDFLTVMINPNDGSPGDKNVKLCQHKKIDSSFRGEFRNSFFFLRRAMSLLHFLQTVIATAVKVKAHTEIAIHCFFADESQAGRPFWMNCCKFLHRKSELEQNLQTIL